MKQEKEYLLCCEPTINVIDFTSLNKNEIFIYGCKLGYFKLVKAVHEKYKINIHAHNDEAFRHSCYNGHLEVAKWLYGLDGRFNIHAEDENVFRYSCGNGHLKVVKWLYELDGKIDIHIKNEHAFLYSCEFGHLKVAKWLYGLDGKINIHVCNDESFCESCANGHLRVVKWLYGLNGKNNTHTNYGYAFRNSCFYGHLEVAKWLYELNEKINIHEANEDVFYWCGIRENLDIAEYLILLENDNIHMLKTRNRMIDGINDHIRKRYKDLNYIKTKKMLLLVNDYDEYHKNIYNINLLISIYYNLDYGFLSNIFGFMKIR